jgi:hypothetical protein
LARRIAAALGRGGRLILVTGDPLADPQFLCQALSNIEGVGYVVKEIRCGPGLRGKDLAAPIFTGSSDSDSDLVTPECSTTASLLFLFVDFDQLSDRQIEEVCKGTVGGDHPQASGVLLAPLDFAARLKLPPLRILKERLAAHFSVQEVGDDEVIPLLHNQLLAQRNRRSESRGFRRGILTGLVVSGVLATAGTGAFVFLYSSAEQVDDAPASIEARRLMREQVSVLQSTESALTNVVPVQGAPENKTTGVPTPPQTPLSATTALTPTELDSLSPGAPFVPAHLSSSHSLSGTEISALVERGDAFFSARDISSARLYYERAAEAGDGQAALQLGASFDPVLLERLGVRGLIGDPAQALSWYRRARELGMPQAEQRIESLGRRPMGDANTQSR